MTKTLLVFALAATLILSTFSVQTNAFASYDNIGNLIVIKTIEGTATCLDINGDSCGTSTIKAKFRTLVTEVDEENGISSGIAQTQLIIDDGTPTKKLLGNPSGSIPPYGPQIFQNNQLNIQAQLIDKDGNMFDFDLEGRFSDFKNGKAKVLLDITLTNLDNGNTITVEDLGGMATEAEGWKVEEGDIFEIREIGSVVVSDPDRSEIYERDVKSKFELLITDVSPLGNAEGVVRGTICILPDIDEQRCDKTIENVGPLMFEYDGLNRIMLTGEMTDGEETTFSYDALGRITQEKDTSVKTESIFNMIGDDGTTVDVENLGFIVIEDLDDEESPRFTLS